MIFPFDVALDILIMMQTVAVVLIILLLYRFSKVNKYVIKMGKG